MNEIIQEISSYVKKLPPHIREIVLHANWEPKVEEIGAKYSLTKDQIIDIGYEVLFVLVGMEPEEDLSENIEIELNVSSILSDQIAEEIESRIIAPLLKQIEQNKNTFLYEETRENALDIPPANLPSEVMEEEFGVVKSVPLQDQVNDFFAPAQMMEQAPEPQVKPEPVYIPQVPEMSTISQPQSFIANKLTQPTVFAPQEEKPPVKYTADPYREPIE